MKIQKINRFIIISSKKILLIIKNLVKKYISKVYPSITIGSDIFVDFLILFILFNVFKMPVFYSNIISTSIALLFNFFINKNYILRHKDKVAGDKIKLFLIITFTGLWLVQPIIITIAKSIFDQLISNNNIILIIGKIFAVIIVLFLNNLLYKKLRTNLSNS